MKYFLAILLLVSATFIFGVNATFANHDNSNYDAYYAYMSLMQNDLNYDCNLQQTGSGSAGTVTCTKNNVAIYSAERINNLTLLGTRTIGTDTQTRYFTYSNSPFIYLHNPPKGTINLSLSSLLDTYFPKPAFNQNNGWVVLAKNGKISVDGNEQSYLFYELSVNNITLNRNGRNFASKEEVVAFLQQSDFLAKLGFTEEEKKNSLDYFLPKLESALDKNYYYLTVLDDESIANISQLDIQPKPEQVLMKYFAVYPTDVTVSTTGDFVFPAHTVKDSTEFTVDVTGEFLVDPAMVVFWNK